MGSFGIGWEAVRYRDVVMGMGIQQGRYTIADMRVESVLEQMDTKSIDEYLSIATDVQRRFTFRVPSTILVSRSCQLASRWQPMTTKPWHDNMPG